MNPILDLIGTSSPPSSPPHSPGTPTATQRARPRNTKLKRLSLNDHAIQEGVKDAMEENPSFRSPSRALFQGNTTDVHFPDTMNLPSPSDRMQNKVAQVSPSRSSQEENRSATPTPASRSQSSATAPSPAASHDFKTNVPVHMESPAHSRGSNNIGRLGYRHSTIGPVSRTPQPHARRARRRSISRERAQRGGIPVDDGNSGAMGNVGGGNGIPQSPSSDISSRPSASSLSHLSPTPPSSQAPPTGPLTLIEKHASLLAYIAHKETEVHEARRTWERRKAELEELKKRWEVVIARQGFHSTTTPSTATAATAAPGAPPHGVMGRQAPMPIRRTGSTSSAGSSSSSSLLRPTTNGEARGNGDGVLPLTIPPTGQQQHASGSSRGAVHPSSNQAHEATHPPQGSRSLFGHLLDSLSGITSDLVPREGQDLNGSVSGTGPVEGRNALVVLDENEGVRDTSTGGGGGVARKAERRQGQGRTGTRQIKTLSLIAGMGSAAAAAKHRHAAAVAAGDGDKTHHESSPPHPHNVPPAPDQAASSRDHTMMPDLIDDLSPARARWNSSMHPSSDILPVDKTHAGSANKVEASSSPPSASSTGSGARGGGMVDFANIWDGFAAAPQGSKDWKERLGHVMGVASPTIHSSQKKATDFLSTNLSHTLEFFSQALPTPNLNALGHPSSSTARAREADPPATSAVLAVGPVRPAVSSRQKSGQGAPELHSVNDKGRQEEEDGSSGGMDIPWNW